MAKKDLTTDEARIIDNLRRMAEKMKYGSIKCTLSVHDGKVQYGFANIQDVRL